MGERGGRRLAVSFRAARFRPPAIPGFRDVPWNAVWEGYVETKGSWEGVGFREVP